MTKEKISRLVTVWNGGDGTFDFGVLGSPVKTIKEAHKEIVEDFITHHRKYAESLHDVLVELVLDDIGEDNYSIEPKDYDCDYNCVYNIEKVAIDV